MTSTAFTDQDDVDGKWSLIDEFYASKGVVTNNGTCYTCKHIIIHESDYELNVTLE